MRTSTTILEKFERCLTSPGWAYCTMWPLVPMMAARTPYRSVFRPQDPPQDSPQGQPHRAAHR